MANILVDPTNTISRGYNKALNMAVGGQQGATRDPQKWMSSATYVRQKLIAVLIAAPGHMKYMDDGDDRIRQLKALVEVRATSITGLNSKLDVTYEEHKVSNAGEVHHTPVQVVRTPSTPTFEWPEVEGMGVFRFFDQWITDLIADAETSHPRLITRTKYQEAGYPEFLPDAIAMTVLFFEPSKDLSRINNAWLCTNMMPRTSGENEGKRVIGEANEVVTQAIEFTSTTQIGDQVTALAQGYVDNLKRDGYRPAALPAAYDAIQADVDVDSEDYKRKLDAVSEAAAATEETLAAFAAAQGAGA